MNSRKLALELATSLANNFEQGLQQIGLEAASQEKIQQQIKALVNAIETDQEYSFIGQELIEHIFNMHPNIAHLIPRDLLWLIGGSCLHYLSNEELSLYNQLDDLRYEAEQQDTSFNWQQQKSRIQGHH